MSNSANFFKLVAEFQRNIDWLNTVLLGNSNSSIIIDGVEKPSIDKAVKDKLDPVEADLLAKYAAIEKQINDNWDALDADIQQKWLALNTDIDDKWAAISAIVHGGRIVKETHVDLVASGNPPANVFLAEVWRDTSEKNGLYGWTGSAWEKSDYDNVTALSNRVGKTESDIFLIKPKAYSAFDLSKSESYKQKIYKNKYQNSAESFARQKIADLGYVPNESQHPIYSGGEVAIAAMDAANKVVAGIGENGLFAGHNNIQDRDPLASEVFALVDDDDRSALTVREGGLVEFGHRKPWELSEITHLLCYGQSLSIGVKGTPLISIEQTYENLMFSCGQQLPDAYTDSDVAAFLPLVAEQEDSLQPGETVLPSCSNALKSKGHFGQFLGTATGVGNMAIATLSKGDKSGYWDRNLFVKQPAIVNSARADKSYSVGAMLWMQGERDGADNFADDLRTPYQEYYVYFVNVWRDFNSDFVDVNHNKSPLPLISYQLSWNTVKHGGEIAQVHLDASNHFDHIYCAGPSYHIKYSSDAIHMDGPAYFIYGHYFARVLDNLIRGNDWKPVHITSVRRSGKGLYLNYHVPTPPLVIDPLFGTGTLDNGFAAYDNQGNKLNITSVALNDNNTVKILLDAAPDSPVILQYAKDYTTTGVNIRDCGSGDIRDSEPETVTYTNRSNGKEYTFKLHNYACHQTIWSD